MTTERILIIDPGGYSIGWALGGRVGDEIVYEDAGLLFPKPKSGGQGLAWIRTRRRNRLLRPQLIALVREKDPNLVVLEVPSGKVNRAHKKSGGAHLATYGRSVGYQEAALDILLPEYVVGLVASSEWTASGRFHGKKEKHADAAELIWPPYAEVRKSDTKFDLADAICIGAWFVQNRLRKRRLPPRQRKEGK